MSNYEYIQFLNNKFLEYLPQNASKCGNKINFRCPICGDSKKSTNKKRGWWYLNTASFYCFNCGSGLTGIKFLSYISGSSYEDIKKEYFKIFLKSEKNLSAYAMKDDNFSIEPNIFKFENIINPNWKNKLTDKAITYLENRLVLSAPYLSDKLYSCFNKDKSEEFILIPWILNGYEAYYQVNDFQKLHGIKYIFPKDKKKLVAGLDNIDISWPYIICFEGFYDSIFVKNGICLGTKSITDYQLKLIKERFPKHQIVISFDNDKAGFDSTANLISKQNNFKYFKWFNQNTKQKDINEFILANKNVNIFTNEKMLEDMIVDKLIMKLFLIKNNLWISKNGRSSTLGKKRKI